MAPSNQGPRPRVAPGWEPKGRRNVKANHSGRRAIPNLNVESDNQGRKLWRENKRPNLLKVLHSGWDPNTSQGSFESFKFVEATSGAHIALSKASKHNDVDTTGWVAEIWGTPEQVKKADAGIDDYFDTIEHLSKSFAKVGGQRPGGQQEVNLHKKLQREQRRSKFCKIKTGEDLLAGKYAATPIVVPWSEESWRVEDALGQQLEALDEIRMDCLCYIYLARQGKETNFVLLGDDEGRLLEAGTRLQQIPARLISHKVSQTQFFLFKPVKQPFDYSAFNIEQIEYKRPAYLIASQGSSDDEGIVGKYFKLKATGIQEGQYLSDDVAGVTSLDELEDHGAFWMGVKETTALNTQYLNLWTTQTFKHLTFYNGHVQMEVAIGTCVFEQHKIAAELPAAEVEDILFDANLGNELEAFIADDLGDHQSRVLLERFITSRPTLIFYDNPLPASLSMDECLASCLPRLKAAFVIEQGPANKVRLEMEFKKNGSGEFDEVSRRWLKLKDTNDTPEELLDVNLLDLEDPHASYSLKITRCDVLNEFQESKLRPVYHQFASKIKPISIDTTMMSKNKRLFTVPATGTGSQVNLRSYEQYRTWLFSIGHGGYFVELFIKSTIDIIPADPTSPSSGCKPQPRREHWGLRVWHESWAGLFKENKDLGIGKKTKWQPTEAQFFPSAGYFDYAEMEGTEAEVGAGFGELLRVLKTVEDIAMGRQEQNKPVEAATDTAEVSPWGFEATEEAITTTTHGMMSLSLDVVKPAVNEAFDRPLDEEFEDMVRITPNMKKKRLGTATAKRNAVIESLGKPSSSADIRATENKSFASLEDKLYGQPKTKQKSTNKSAASKRKGKNTAGAQDNSWPAPKPVVASTNGSWSEDSGPKGPMPKLPTPPNGRQTAIPPVRAPIPPATKSWASVAQTQKKIVGAGAKQVTKSGDQFPALGSKKK